MDWLSLKSYWKIFDQIKEIVPVGYHFLSITIIYIKKNADKENGLLCIFQ